MIYSDKNNVISKDAAAQVDNSGPIINVQKQVSLSRSHSIKAFKNSIYKTCIRHKDLFSNNSKKPDLSTEKFRYIYSCANNKNGWFK